MKTNNVKEKARILVLDDEENNLFSFKTAFRKQYLVDVALTPKEAFDFLESNSYQIIVSDQRMPEISGIDFLCEVKERFPQAIRILMTAFEEAKPIVKAINEGLIFYYVNKPWQETQLELVLQKALEKYNFDAKFETSNLALKKAYHELDRLVYSASHDLRGPLTSILGLSNLLIEEGINAKAEQYVSLIQESSNKLLTMLSSLQDFSILHKPMAEPENCNVKSQIEDVWNKVQEEEKVKNVKLYFTDYKVTNVCCNTLLLKLALHKILQNAVHFQGPNNTNASIEIRVENKSGILLIAVKDNGMGVKGIQVEQLFHMFFRGSEHSKGAGLGLYIAREAIEKLNGKISIHSEIGTEVTIEIPNLC